jgi:hypothetical protein
VKPDLASLGGKSKGLDLASAEDCLTVASKLVSIVSYGKAVIYDSASSDVVALC